MLNECQTGWTRMIHRDARSLIQVLFLFEWATYILTKSERVGEINLTLSPPSTTEVLCANNLDPDETPSNSASHPDPRCLTLRQHFHQLLSDIEAL